MKEAAFEVGLKDRECCFKPEWGEQAEETVFLTAHC